MAERHNNRGRIGKANKRGAAKGTSIRGAASRGTSRGGGRGRPAASLSKAKELLPDLVRDRCLPPKTTPNLSRPANDLHVNPPRAAQEHQERQETAVESSSPKVERIYNDIWASGPASFAFATHGNLDHSEDTLILALNILDHIIRPENWNPELSNNKLSAACFFFACKLTDDKNVTADQIADSIWTDPKIVAEMSQSSEGPLYERALESLSVSAAQVVQGYEILFDQQQGLKDLLGGYAKGLAGLPLPAAEKQLLPSQIEGAEPYRSLVADEMSGATVDGMVVTGPQDHLEVVTTSIPEDPKPEERAGEAELDDFDIFVANNE